MMSPENNGDRLYLVTHCPGIAQVTTRVECTSGSQPQTRMSPVSGGAVYAWRRHAGSSRPSSSYFLRCRPQGSPSPGTSNDFGSKVSSDVCGASGAEGGQSLVDVKEALSRYEVALSFLQSGKGDLKTALNRVRDAVCDLQIAQLREVWNNG